MKMPNRSTPFISLLVLAISLLSFSGTQLAADKGSDDEESAGADSAAAPASVDEKEEVSKPLVHLLKIRTVDTEGGMIDPGITAFVERAVQDANEADADAIVFEIDTFGGRVDAATVISDAIIDADPLTIAFINKRAISAGALISLACDKIVMVKG